MGMNSLGPGVARKLSVMDRWRQRFSEQLVPPEPDRAALPLDSLSESLQRLGITPQPKQVQVLHETADIVIFGGAAYAGKTFALLLEPLHHIANRDFGATIFRRTYSRITVEGGMWDESQKLYRPLGAVPSKMNWTFPQGASVNFAHLQHAGDEFAYYGSQICLLCFDQLEEFSSSQFFYMLGRNRSTCGVRPYCRATCNPDPDSWLATFLSWWIDAEGFPIAARAGCTRWFIRTPNDDFAWANTDTELYETYGPGIFPKSVAFIPGTLEDNPVGRERDPHYESNLMLQVGYLRERLRYGNWKARPTAGQFFKRHWFDVVPAAPADCQWVRVWDRAGTEPSPQNPDPDYTAGVLVGRDPAGYIYVADVQRDRVSSSGVEAMIHHTAAQDGHDVRIVLLKDPGQAGKMEVEYHVRQLAGYTVVMRPQTINKETTARPFASQAEAGNVRLVAGAWNAAWLTEADGFPGGHDDQIEGAWHGFLALTEDGGPAQDVSPDEMQRIWREAQTSQPRPEPEINRGRSFFRRGM